MTGLNLFSVFENLNPILNADAYTISGPAHASEACKFRSVYNFVNRYSPQKNIPDLAYDSRMIFYGLKHWLANSPFFRQRITHKHVDHALKFMGRAHSFGGKLPLDEKMWRRVVDEFGGYLPINIYAIPEGSTFFPGEMPVQVESTAEGFGELAAHIEASMVGTISIGTAAATLVRHWLERMRDEVRKDLGYVRGVDPATIGMQDIDEVARWQIHNFGKRASSVDEESVLIGMAHLLSFHGTDNFDAASMAWDDGMQDPTGTSIMALAHRNVQGHKIEDNSYLAIANATEGEKFRIASLVGDCYDYWKAVRKIVGQAIKMPEVCHVPRPDSDDTHNTIKHIFDVCSEMGVYNVTNNWKVPKNVRYIYGDSVKPRHQFDVMRQLRLEGMLPTLWGIWGVGGFIRNTPNRDTLSSAFKLCEIGDGEPVVKLAVPTKLSVPYRNEVIRYIDPMDTKITVIPEGTNEVIRGAYRLDRTVVRNGDVVFVEPFPVVQNRTIKSFDEFSEFAAKNPEFGLHRDNLHASIVDVQDRVYHHYRG